MNDLGAVQIGVLEKFLVTSQPVKLYSCFVARNPGGSAPVSGGVLDDLFGRPDGWFARLLRAHETSLLSRRRTSPPARDDHGAMARGPALGRKSGFNRLSALTAPRLLVLRA